MVREAGDSLQLRALIAAHPSVSGVVTGSGLGVPHVFLAKELSIALSALTLALIAGIYIGFAIVRGTETAFGVELVAAVGYTLVALLGITLTRWLIPLGLIAHGGWDLAHRRRRAALTDVPRWYVPFCAVVDLVYATALLAIWFARG